MVSRDGENWTRYETPYYFPSGWSLNGRDVVEAVTHTGLIRQGNEVWQFGTARFTAHGGALYGGKEGEGSVHDRLLLLKQRLDGFVSLDAHDATGVVVTYPMLVDGGQLVLNVNAKGGTVRVAILNADGESIDGFALDDCDPIQVDDVEHTITWKKKAKIPAVSGKVIKVKFKLQNAKIYAMQFK